MLTELRVILLNIGFLDIYFFQLFLAKMNINTCIKTEPTIMADYEIMVNICNINMIRLLIIVFVKGFIFVAIAGAP